MKNIFTSLYRSLGLSKNIQLSLMRVINDQFLIGLTGIIFNNKNEILLFKHTYRQQEWSLPGGYMKGKEHPREGLEREIKEESGFVVTIDQRLKIRTDREGARLDISYIGTFLGGDFVASTEVSEAQFFSFENLPIIRKDQLIMIDEALQKKKKELFPSKNI